MNAVRSKMEEVKRGQIEKLIKNYDIKLKRIELAHAGYMVCCNWKNRNEHIKTFKEVWKNTPDSSKRDMNDNICRRSTLSSDICFCNVFFDLLDSIDLPHTELKVFFRYTKLGNDLYEYTCRGCGEMSCIYY